jgi:hypothetical protein
LRKPDILAIGTIFREFCSAPFSPDNVPEIMAVECFSR